MNIHIISNDKFVEKFVWLIDTMYPQGSNIVYIHSNVGKTKDITSPSVKYIDAYEEIDFSVLSEKNKVFIHGFYNTSLVRFLVFKCRFLSADQLVLIIWGADLYDARAKLREPGMHLKVRINEIIKKRLIKRCNKYMTFACDDFDLICKWYGAKGRQFDCIYPTNADVGLLNNLVSEHKKGDETRILLGNSATPSNQHIQAIKQLRPFADRNIMVLCPLSYGDMDYAEKVCEIGNKELGWKFKPIREYMSVEDYSSMLNSVDLAIFYNNRQQATGNIEILAYLNKKIFVRSDTTTWNHYVRRDRCRFFDALRISSMTFEDFITVNTADLMYNHDYISKIWDATEIKKLWDVVMEA